MNAEWFKQKELGLPIWAWTIIAAVLIFVIWKRFGGSLGGLGSSGSPNGTSGLTDPNSPDASGAAAGSLVPTPLDNTGTSLAPSAIGTDPLPVFDATGVTGDPHGVDTVLPADNSQADPSSVQAPNPIPVSSRPGTSLKWGGETFFTKSDFKLWAAAHGSSVARELALHPAAAAIYAGLAPGYAGPVTKGGTKQPTKLVGKKSPVLDVGGQRTATSTPSPISDVGSSIGSRPVTAPPTKAGTAVKSLPTQLDPNAPTPIIRPGTRIAV